MHNQYNAPCEITSTIIINRRSYFEFFNERHVRLLVVLSFLRVLADESPVYKNWQDIQNSRQQLTVNVSKVHLIYTMYMKNLQANLFMGGSAPSI